MFNTSGKGKFIYGTNSFSWYSLVCDIPVVLKAPKVLLSHLLVKFSKFIVELKNLAIVSHGEVEPS